MLEEQGCALNNPAQNVLWSGRTRSGVYRSSSYFETPGNQLRYVVGFLCHRKWELCTFLWDGLCFPRTCLEGPQRRESTFLPVLQRRRQVEKVSAHSPCAIANKRSPLPLGKEGNKCMSHGCELVQGRGKLWDLAPCTEERGDWEEMKEWAVQLHASSWVVSIWGSLILPRRSWQGQRCMSWAALAQQDQPIGNTLPSFALCRWTVAHTVGIYLWLLGKRTDLCSASGAGATLNCLNPPPVNLCLGRDSLPGTSTWWGPMLRLSAIGCPMFCSPLAVAK